MDAPTPIATAPSTPLSVGARRWLTFALLLGLLGPGWIAWNAPPNDNYDERFSMKNVEWVLRSGRLLPRSYYWYAPPAYLPQAWLLAASSGISRASGRKSLETWTAEPRFSFTAWGTRLSRLPGVLYGVVALGALANLALRLAGPWAAVLAPLIFTSSPWFHAGIYGFKPDPLLLALSLLCLAQLGRYLQLGRAGDFWLAALLFGAATAAKLNGALLAVPLALAAFREPTWRARWRRIALGGLCGVAVYLLLVPWPRPLEALLYLDKLDAQYDQNAEAEGALDLLGILLSRLAAPHFFGRWIAFAAIAGLCLLLWRAGRRRGAQLVTGWRVVLAYGVTNLAFLGATTRYPKENHLLPVLPLVALLAALPLAEVVHGLQRRQLRALASMLVAALAAFATVRATSFAATKQVPAPRARLAKSIQHRLDGRSGRVVAWFSASRDPLDFGRVRRGRPPAAARLAPSALAHPAALAAYDCIAGAGPLPQDLPAESERRFHPRALRRLAWPARLLPGRSEQYWFGCAPWRRSGRIDLVLEPSSAHTLRAAVPTSGPEHQTVSLELWSRRWGDVLGARLDGRPLPLLFSTVISRHRGVLQVTARSLSSPSVVELELRPGAAELPRVALLFWGPPAAARETPPGS